MRNLLYTALLLTLAFSLPFSGNTQPTNLNFENWTNDPNNNDPVDWLTIDQLNLTTNNGNPVNLNSEGVVEENNNPGQGSASAKLRVVTSDINVNIDGFMRQDVAFTQRPDSFSFSYRPNIAGNDTAAVIFELTQWSPAQNDAILVGSGILLITGSSGNWQSVKLPYNYQNNLTPDSLSMIAFADFSGSNISDGTIGTELDVDEFDPFGNTVICNLNAGESDTVAKCKTNDLIDLTSELNGNPDAGGTWYDDDNTGALTNGQLNLSQVQSGQTYNFTYVVSKQGCDNDTSQLGINLQPAPNPGRDTAIYTCESQGITSLSQFLSSDAESNGTWIDEDNTNNLIGDQISPQTLDPSKYDQSYDFSYQLDNGVCTRKSTINVTYNSLPNAGLDTSVYACNTQKGVYLPPNMKGNPDMNGTWIDSTYIKNDSFDIAAAGAGNYNLRYLATAKGCTSDTSTLNLQVNEDKSAGTSDTTVKCSDNGAIDLLSQLNGNPDTVGSWSDLDNTGALSNGSVDATMLQASTTYNYKYQVDVDGCATQSTTLGLTIAAAPQAGKDSLVLTCKTGGSIDLLQSLNGSPESGGTWSDDDNTGALNNGMFDPANVSNGDYQFTYEVSNNQCGKREATATVSVIDQPDPGNNGTTKACGNDMAVDLFEQLQGNPQEGGTWSGNQSNALTNGIFNPSKVAPDDQYQFTYTVSANGCSDQSANVTVTVNVVPNPGMDTSVTVSGQSSNVNLLNQLAGNPDTSGTWSDDNNTGALNDGILDATSLEDSANYSFTYTATKEACEDSSATLSVFVEKVSGIREYKREAIKFYPNPASDEVTLEAPLAAKEVRIYDLTGRAQMTKPLKGDQTKFNVSQFEEGMYFYQVRNGEGNVIYTGKFTIASH